MTAHLGASTIQEITHKACMTPESEHLKPNTLLSQNTSMHTTSTKPSSDHVVIEIYPIAMESKPLLPVATVLQSQACIEKAHESPPLISSSDGKPLGKGGDPVFIFSTTTSLEKSSPKPTQKKLDPDVKEVSSKLQQHIRLKRQ